MMDQVIGMASQVTRMAGQAVSKGTSQVMSVGLITSMHCLVRVTGTGQLAV